MGERLVYRIAGLPVAISGLLLGSDSGDPADALRSVYAWQYWHPQGPGEWTELVLGLVASPIAILLATTWYTFRNGAVVRKREGRSLAAQVRDQLRLYFSAGVLPPWYYIFSLSSEGRKRANTFIHRYETKPCLFRLLKRPKGSPLNDKARFADYCSRRRIRCVETILRLDGEHPGCSLPEVDIFVKPVKGRGGTGAERWDWVAPGEFRGVNGERLQSAKLLARLVEQSRRRPLIVQGRQHPHRALREITAGALPTVRVLTCLNERSQPEVMAAVLRTSFGENVTVDNLHAGGIGALVDVECGILSISSNLGSDARLGWFSAHPDTGAPIEGRVLPFWDETKALAVAAHREFADRVVIGWDIAILDDGPILIEGNGNPDLDILQRFMRVGFRQHRFAELIAAQLRLRSAFPPPHSAPIASSHEADDFHPHERQADAGGARFGPQLPPQ